MPEYARGKTAQEVLGLTQRLVQHFTSQQPPAPTPTPNQPVALDPEGYVTGGQVQAWVQQQARDSFMPDVTAGIELAASANLGLVKNQFAKEFQKYGPEITARLAGVPKKSWTLDNLQTVVKLVQADHLAEIQTEWETEFRAKNESTMRSGGAAGSVPVPEKNKEASLESEKIPAEWKLRAQNAGVTEATVREFCAHQGMSEEAFYKQFETPRNPIVAEVQVGR